ncbi:MAG TPA: hypothetical protein EYN71_08250, partial [Flavobacteriales bacterium]|nr:hypothetical protein [Flavobacteriales bacterium]
MKTLITLFTAVLLSQAITAQTTLIPDANFEQALIDRGYDTGTPNGSVLTANIDMVTFLNVHSKSISDLTGIEDFTALIYLYCHDNQLASLDVSQNTSLVELFCWENQLTSLDVSQNTALTYLACGNNQLTSLDVSNNIVLDSLFCNNNQLTCLNVKNGNNINMESSFNGWGFWPSFNALNNPSLICIEVDDMAWSAANWTVANGSIDGTPSFSNNCNNPCSSSTTGIAEYGHSFNLYPNPT